jgi:hypothetical protein
VLVLPPLVVELKPLFVLVQALVLELKLEPAVGDNFNQSQAESQVFQKNSQMSPIC